MAVVDAKEADMVLVAMQLDEQLGDRVLPFHEMQIIAFYHPEEETRRLVGKAIVRQALKSDEPEERKAAKLSDVSTDARYHAEAREDAGKALCGIIRKAGTWEKAYSIAIDSRYPKETRETAASDFLDNAGGKEGTAAILGCSGISGNVRQDKGFRVVKEALEAGNRELIVRIAAQKGIPGMLALYIRNMVGNGAGSPRFGKERISESPPKDMKEALEALPRKK